MGKGHRRCEVCGIKEAWQTENKLLFSNFPLDPNRCREWLKAVGNEELVYLPIEKLHDQRNVCAKHFGKKDFNKKGNRLKRHAVPTLHLMALPLTDSQLAEFPQHLYTKPKESCPPATEQKENIHEVQSDFKKLLTDFHNEVVEDPENKEDASGKSTCVKIPKQVGIGESVPASSSQDYPMVSIPEEFETMETNLTETEQQPIVYVQQCCLVESYRQSGLEGLATKSKIVACPKHFNTEDFHDMLEKCRKNEKNIDVPTVQEYTYVGIDDDDVDDDDDHSHQDFEIPDEIKVCRVCLALDVKMYDMKDFKLGEMFQNVTGIVAANNHSIFERVCWECAARLKAAAAFRDKALLSDFLLQDLVRTRNHIQKNDITSIKEKHSNLKSSLCIRNVFLTKDANENKPNEPPKYKDIKTYTIVRKDLKELEMSILKKLKTNEMEVEESEPLIDDPIKTEIEIDPLYIYNKIDDTLALEITPHDTNDREDNKSEETLLEDCEDKITKHELRIQNYDNIFNDGYKNSNKMDELTIINDNGHTYLKEDKVKTKNVKVIKIDGVDKRISSDKNVVKKMPVRKKVASKTGVKKKIATNTRVKKKTTKDNTSRIDEETKKTIISLKRKGVPDTEISQQLDVTDETIRICWERWCEEHYIKCYVPSGRRRPTTTQKVTPSVRTQSLAQECAISSKTSRMRLREAGFRPTLKKDFVPHRSGGRHRLDEKTKQEIISLKQAGVSVADISRQLGVTPSSVYLWWRCWCHENKTSSGDSERKTTATAGRHEEQTSHTPAVPASQKTTWEHLPYS